MATLCQQCTRQGYHGIEGAHSRCRLEGGQINIEGDIAAGTRWSFSDQDYLPTQISTMAHHRKKIKPSIKRYLVREAGSKCANPGCSNWRVHIHHIKHWAVYESHDVAHMIAICPSCHDAAHHGHLRITNKVVYSWKGICRSGASDSAQIYVEPGGELKILTGSITLSTVNSQATVFDLSSSNRLKLRILDGDILQVTSRLQTLKGKEVLRVVENHIRVADDPDVRFHFRAGHARVTVPSSVEYIPPWLVQQIQTADASFANEGRIVALDLEVLKPGFVRVTGYWPADNHAIVITQNAVYFCRQSQSQPLISWVGYGEGSELRFLGPITRAIFEFR